MIEMHVYTFDGSVIGIGKVIYFYGNKSLLGYMKEHTTFISEMVNHKYIMLDSEYGVYRVMKSQKETEIEVDSVMEDKMIAAIDAIKTRNFTEPHTILSEDDEVCVQITRIGGC